MQKLMPQVDTPDNAFHDGNPATGELGTPVYAVWLNAVQGAVRDIQAECHAILTANGFTPDPSRQTQLWEAIQKAIDSKVPAASTTQAGKVQLSSATDSSSEQTAATSKAVKAVKDYADTKAPLNSPALSGTPTAPTPPDSATGQEIANAAFVAAKVAKLVDSSPAALDTLKELADALGRDPNFATTMTNALAGKQPLNSTLTALSGKNVVQLIEYLQLGETVGLAQNAWSKKFVKILSSGDFSSCSVSGIYQVSIPNPASVSDFPNFGGVPLYNYGVMYVASDGGVISQTYISHIGQVAVRTKWNDQLQFKSWVVQYSPICEPVTFKYGSPLIGSLIPWSRSQMPHEIWPDCGMEFIPWMAQSFDPSKYPLLHDLFPSNTLPVDMRGYTDRGWDNGRGIDPGRGLLSVQEDALQNVTGTFKCNSWRDGPVSATGALYNGGSESGGSPNNAANNAQVLGFDMSRAPGVRTSTETRMKNVAWNMIVRAK
ncbi:phage tail protein [Edwardsiella piscicida]|nr:tail fiber protein [Edwardsiella piscicida]